MSKLVSGMPATNTHGSTRDPYSLIQVLVAQVDAMNPTIVSTSEAVTIEDGQLLLVTTGAIANVLVNLPVAADSVGVKLTVKKVDADLKSAVITPNDGAETIDGAATLELAAQYDVVTIQCDGTVWHVVNSVIA